MKRFSTLLLLAVLFYACQKEANFEEARTQGTGRLLKTFTQEQNGDTATFNFVYTSNGLLQSFAGTTAVPSGTQTLTYLIGRTGGGIIQQYTKIESRQPGGTIDSVTYTLSYDAASKQYKNSVLSLVIFGSRVLDSTIFLYNGLGKISVAERYTNINMANTLQKEERFEYTYAGENLTEIKKYDLSSSGVFGLSGVLQTSQYDTKLADLQLGNEAIVMGLTSWIAAANPLQQKLTRFSGNIEDAIYKYEYTSFDQPKTGMRISTAIGNQPDTARFSYTYY